MLLEAFCFETAQRGAGQKLLATECCRLLYAAGLAPYKPLVLQEPGTGKLHGGPYDGEMVPCRATPTSIKMPTTKSSTVPFGKK